MEATPVVVKKEKKEVRKEQKSEKKVDRPKAKKEKKEDTGFLREEIMKLEPAELSLADRLGTLAPLLMATGGAIAYTRFPVVQSFVNSAVGQLMESLVSPERGETPKGPRGCAPVSLSPAS